MTVIGSCIQCSQLKHKDSEYFAPAADSGTLGRAASSWNEHADVPRCAHMASGPPFPPPHSYVIIWDSNGGAPLYVDTQSVIPRNLVSLMFLKVTVASSAAVVPDAPRHVRVNATYPNGWDQGASGTDLIGVYSSAASSRLGFLACGL